MALDRKKLQKKKAKKAAKKKARKSREQKGGAIMGIAGKMAINQAIQSPIHECWEPEQLYNSDQGIGTIIVSRKTQRNDILIAAFLVDIFCLGVKNAHIKLMSKEEYHFSLENIREQEDLKAIHPSCARKLVEGAEAYATELGISPHKDYQSARKIFGDIEKEVCPRSFEFGKNGKPFYLAGPYDSSAFSRRIVKTLMDKFGPDGFHYLLPLDDPNSLFD